MDLEIVGKLAGAKRMERETTKRSHLFPLLLLFKTLFMMQDAIQTHGAIGEQIRQA